MFGKLPKFNDQDCVHFVTTKTFKNYPYFKDERCCSILLENLDFHRKKQGFKILGYTIMPDHLHCLIFWDIKEYPKLTISKAMMGIKGYSAKSIIEYLSEQGQLPLPTREGENKLHRREWKHQIWQPGFYDFNVCTEKKFYEKLEYMHNNPINAGLCKILEDYRWSSYKQNIGIIENALFKIDSL
jgi:putative transposase